MAASSSSSEVVQDDTIRKTALPSQAREITEFDRVSDDADSGNYDAHGHLRNTRGEVDEGFTKHDKHDMKRMGKAQELRRNFRPLSTLAFTVILQGTWEVLLAAST